MDLGHHKRESERMVDSLEGMDEGHPTYDGPDNESEGMAGIAHECDTRYHCCVHDGCYVGAVSGECVLVGSRKGVSPLREDS